MESFDWIKNRGKTIKLALLSVFMCSNMLLPLFTRAFAAQEGKEWLVRVVSVQGDVQMCRADEALWSPVKLNDVFYPNDRIRTNENSRVSLIDRVETTIRLKPNSGVTFLKEEEDKSLWIRVFRGVVHFFNRYPQRLKLGTRYVNGFVEGTEFLVAVKRGEAVLTVFSGRVVAVNKAGSLVLTNGQTAVAVEGKAPELRLMVHPRDAVRWALYYPPVIDFHQSDFSGGNETGWQGMVRRSIGFYWEGDLTNAFSSLEKAPPDIRDPRFFTYRAALLLTVGRVDEAGADIKRALELAPGNSRALALQSIIALTQNEKGKALELANKAVELNPASATARIALSYARQAHFQLREALASLQEAVKLAPKNALAWARLAELLLSMGRLDKALEAAREAMALNPDLSRTQTVLGFAYLTRIKIKEAKESFEKAIELDNGAPLPRLGLGLAKIRGGDLSGGREGIEIAVGLDPDNSLIRSYLGKAFYEEKRDKLAKTQLDVAKELDPNDPTPWFYDAIRKQSVNRPVEALHDLQKSIELNDNRAVYRSRLLLDQDLAARSASLARIYNDLGFQQLALVEGWKSLNHDPANFSAHRFLADSYYARPRHEIARVSELLQAQLLQPININPVQPGLAETNLFILEGAGPTDPSFNEFNSLFNRNRLALYAGGVAGTNGTYGDDLVQNGVWGRMSYSLGQFHYETDGYRENDDQKEDIYNAFFQASLSPKTSLQAEWRDKRIERGDLGLRFDPDNFFTDLREKVEFDSIRLGFHHAFSPRSDVIGSVIFADAETTLHNIIPPTELTLHPDDDGNSYELQHLYRAERFNIISGAGYFQIHRKDEVTTSLTLPLPIPPFSLLTTQTITEESNIRHTNLYLYSQIFLPKRVTLTLGGSADFFEGGIVDENQFNPKLGVIWNPYPNTLLRGSVFRTLKRTLITDQTLEPTQVAGFNQFFDDGEGTESWRYGVALDQKFSPKIYGGLEYSQRDLEAPYEFLPPPPAPQVLEARKADWKENLFRSYLYWAPHPWVVLSGEYQYEKFDRNRDFTAGIGHIETHAFPLGMGFYHPSGFEARLRASYIDQEVLFQPQESLPGTFVSGGDQFWLVDASVGYRFPKRLGFITLEARNLFDKFFKYYDTDPVSPIIQPERTVFLKLTLAF